MSNAPALRGFGVVVIDMQPLWLKMIRPRDQKRLVPEHLRILARCAALDIPVVLVEYAGDDLGETIAPIREAVARVPRNGYFLKKTDDAFGSVGRSIYATKWINRLLWKMLPEPQLSGERFREELERLGLECLFVMGINEDYCVWETAVSARGNGFRVMTAMPALSSNNPVSNRSWYAYRGMLVESFEEALELYERSLNGTPSWQLAIT